MAYIKEVFEALVDEVVDAAEDVTLALDWRPDLEAARGRLRKSRQALREFLEKQMENR